MTSGCCICGKGMAQGVNLYRINEKGVAAIWACKKHLTATDAPPIDREVAEIVEIINLEASHD